MPAISMIGAYLLCALYEVLAQRELVAPVCFGEVCV